MQPVRRARLDGRPGLAIFTGALLLGLLAWIVFSLTSTGDYHLAGPVGGNNAGPGIEALLHGSLAGYVAHQPVVGLTSILLRLPFVALATALGGGSLLGYQVGALACLLPLIVCGAWLVSAAELSTQQRLLRLAAVLLVVQSPILHNNLAAGHPEGTLSIVLATISVLVAMRGRAGWAALLLGLSIAAKETGVIGLIPVLLALPGQRRKVAAITGGVILLLCGTVWLSDPDALLRSLHGEGATRYLIPLSLLWPLSAPLHLGAQLSVARVMPLGLSRTHATLLTLACAAPVGVLWFVRARRRGATPDPLVMLVLLGLLRCVLDSTHEAYYWISFLIPLATWEALQSAVPVKTLVLNVAVFVIFWAVGRVAPGYVYVTATAGEVVLMIYLARRAMVSPRPVQAFAPAYRWALAGSPSGQQH